MAKHDTNRRHPIKRWLEKQAAKAARTDDTPEKLAERRKVGARPDAKEAAARAGDITIAPALHDRSLSLPTPA